MTASESMDRSPFSRELNNVSKVEHVTEAYDTMQSTTMALVQVRSFQLLSTYLDL